MRSWVSGCQRSGFHDAEKNNGAPFPKFEDWDVNDPTSGEDHGLELASARQQDIGWNVKFGPVFTSARRKRKLRQAGFASRNDRGRKCRNVSDRGPSKSKKPTQIDEQMSQPTQIDAHTSAKRKCKSHEKESTSANKKKVVPAMFQKMKFRMSARLPFHYEPNLNSTLYRISDHHQQEASSFFPCDRTLVSYGHHNNRQREANHVFHQLPGYHHHNYQQPIPRFKSTCPRSSYRKMEHLGLELLKTAIAKAGYTDKVVIGMDVAASELYGEIDKTYDLNFKEENNNGKEKISGEQLKDLYKPFVSEYPIVSIEGSFDQDDWEHYGKMTAEWGEHVQIVGDDLLVTNPTVRITSLCTYASFLQIDKQLPWKWFPTLSDLSFSLV
ncbi:enolase 1 [Tanacetum coccineum]